MNSEKARHFLEVFFSERFPGDDGVSGQVPGYHNHRRLLLIGLASAHHALGDAAASDAALRGMIETYGEEWPYNIAYALAFRGEADRAFAWLDKAVAYNDPGLAEITAEPLLANIQSDPRWLPFLESIGMSPQQLAAIEYKVTLPE